jgi:hypothetical protein
MNDGTGRGYLDLALAIAANVQTIGLVNAAAR